MKCGIDRCKQDKEKDRNKIKSQFGIGMIQKLQ